MTTKPLFDHQPQVAIDFDGTLFPYTKGWTGAVPDILFAKEKKRKESLL